MVFWTRSCLPPAVRVPQRGDNRTAVQCGGHPYARGRVQLRGAKRAGSVGVAILYALIGAVIGTWVGHWVAHYWAPLGRYAWTVGSGVKRPWTLDLEWLGVQFGFWLHINVVGLVGLLAGLGVYRRGR
jgi:hypothetical protein